MPARTAWVPAGNEICRRYRFKEIKLGLEKILFLDIEASSLDRGSFPIEIGWIANTGHEESYLIRPEAGWKDWSIEAETLHGITRAHLEAEGLQASEVAERFVAAAENRQLVSDAPDFDRAWLDRLLSIIGRRAPKISFAQAVWGEAIRNRLDPDAPRNEQIIVAQQLLKEAMQHVGYEEPRHRALADAKALWQVWRHLGMCG